MFDLHDAVVAAIAALVTGFFGWLINSRKVQTEETSIVLGAWKEILTPLREQLAETQKQLMDTKTELAKLQAQFEVELSNRDKRELQLLQRIRELESHDKKNTYVNPK
jgi:predicted  nucleic acid-binding Zn-ribbon protein